MRMNLLYRKVILRQLENLTGFIISVRNLTIRYADDVCKNLKTRETDRQSSKAK